jgi:hypothetical protein
MEKMKKIVYTVLFGDYILYEPTVINKDWQLLCFSDRPRQSKNWKVKVIDCGKDIRKKSREVKIRFDRFLDCDLCLYLDAKFKINVDLDMFVKDNLKHDLCVMRHNKIICAYAAAYFCIKKGIGDKHDILKQIDSYKKEGFPENFGLYAPGIMLRKNTKEIIDFMTLWYEEIEKFGYRDIPGFSYVLWKTPIKLDTMPFKKTYRQFR